MHLLIRKRLNLGITPLIVSNEEMSDIMKIVKSLECGLLIKEVCQKIKKEAKK